jgi:hypothetical protein
MIMLLHSNRLLSWIEQRHLNNVQLLAGNSDNGNGQDDDIRADVWIMFHQLATEYWRSSPGDAMTLNKTLAEFWWWFVDVDRNLEVEEWLGAGAEFRDPAIQQDAAALLDRIMSLSCMEFEYLLEWKADRLDTLLGDG